MNQCEFCGVEIPRDFGNPMCLPCYEKIEKGEVLKKLSETSSEPEKPEMEVGLDGVPNVPQNEPETPNTVPSEGIQKLTDLRPGKNGIWDPEYTENPQKDDKPQWEANIVQFAKSNILLWNAQRQMYTFIKNYIMRSVMEHPQYPKYVWKAKVVDVGSGIGVGANIVSQEADLVWGIDKNEKSVMFAQQAFTREKNGIYYNSQVSFDHFDIMEDTRETMKFDVVIAIEIIEHINDYKTFLTNIINKFAKKDKNGNYAVEDGATLFFISTPNRNHPGIKNDQPNNIYHCREWSSTEFIAVLSEYFNEIELMKADGVVVPLDTDHTPLLARCSLPRL